MSLPVNSSGLEALSQGRIDQTVSSEADRIRLEIEGIRADDQREKDGHLYPDIRDPSFLEKLLRKREFRESKQAKITDDSLKKENDVCEVKEFEYTPVQRFVTQFLSPNTPYNGILLFHGVGVGKTCTAISTAEAFLELTPKNKVYILAPPTIQAGFYRTIFDSTRVKLGVTDDTPNQHDGCTGNRYLELTQTQFDRNIKDIELRVNRLINKRYSIMGYVAFRNMVRDILSQIPTTMDKTRKKEQEIKLLQKALSGCLIIIDEAHNLRDVSDVDEETDRLDDAGGVEEKGDAAAGKKLAPFLKHVLRSCEGNKLLLMSATPMYNSYKEIISLLEYLLLVDHADEREIPTETDIEFVTNSQGDEVLSEKSEKMLVQIANGRVSFMRGENPKAFPSRLEPPDESRIKTWPALAPNGLTRIEPEQQKEDVLRLPMVNCELTGDALNVIKTLTERLVAAKGVGIRTIDTLLQAGNCIFPGEGVDGRVGSEGFQSWFSSRSINATFEGTRLTSLPQYIPRDDDESYTWMTMGKNNLGKYSPKFNTILQTIKNATGISFVHSRFVENGAVIFCLLLEANGYTAWGRSAPLFSKGIISPGRRQCAKCEKREVGHPPFVPGQQEGRENHKFTPAYYALLTASDVNTVDKQSLPLSPNNTRLVNVARDAKNADGSKIKVVVGSQVAGEGIDLRAIREVHIFEGWFHLSKQEQIIGRGIRYCSHQALPRELRNCTISLYVNTFPAEFNKETIDQYSYRTAMNKAVRIGNVSRALQMGAVDCNLNREAILLDGLTDVEMINSQRKPITVDLTLKNKDFTAICDWIKCPYQCKNPSGEFNLDFNKLEEDDSTYDVFTARFAEQSMILRLKRLFKDQIWFRWKDIQNIFSDIPKETLTSLLLKVINNHSIVFENGNFTGRIVYRNSLFLFQPNKIQDESIPLTLRYGQYPVKRDSYEPVEITGTVAPMILKAAPTQAVKATAVSPDTKVDSTAPLTTTTAAPTAPLTTAPAAPVPPATAALLKQGNIDAAREFWKQVNIWIDSWTESEEKIASISEMGNIPDSETNPLSRTILTYTEDDHAIQENIETRLKKLQWFAKVIHGVVDGIRDLRVVARQFVWDSFLKGAEQFALLQENAPYTNEAGNEQKVELGTIKALRYLDIQSLNAIYICNGSLCPPSVLQLFLSSKTDPVVNAVANQRVTGELYGFVVPWENSMMFKTNEPKPEGKEPGSGAACSIVSNVSGHRKKLVQLGEILARYHGGRKFHLTDDELSSGLKKLTGAPNFCALMEIVMRWMDMRREHYGNQRYFYRPLSAFYSKHKSKNKKQ